MISGLQEPRATVTMAPKRKKIEETVARRSSRSPATKKTTSATLQEKESVAKKAKVTASSKDDEVELRTPRRRSVSSKENDTDGKEKKENKVVGDSSPTGKSADEGDDDLIATNVKIKHGKADVAEDEGSPVSLSTAAGLSNRTIIIEACTQCKSFKERAEKVKKSLESAIPGISVNINPETPRRGYFEISEKRTEVILSLPSMKRPFTSMKKLNMDELIGDLLKRFK